VDLLILSDQAQRERVVASLTADGFTVNQAWQDANPLAQGKALRLSHSHFRQFPLDLIFSLDAHERETLRRRREERLEDLAFWICSPEDLILLKLKVGRPTDFDDALSVLKNPRLQLDLTYLRDWADRLGIQGELQYVMGAAQS
jgi:hypothetical protein